MTPAQSLWSTVGFARRQLIRTVKSPALLLPPLLFPLLLFGAFAGGLSALGAAPNFGYPDYTTFQFVWVLLVGVALAGAATGLALAQDFDSGFARRIMLATSARSPLIVGYVLSSLVRAVVVVALVFAVGLAAGMEVSGSPLEVIAVIALALMFNLLVALFSIGVALRIRSLQAGPIIQTPLLIAVFLMPVYTPRALLSGWVQAAADGNPLTPVIEAARGLIVGQPERVALAFGISAGLIVLFAVFAATGLRRAENPIPSPRRARRRARRPTPRVAHESSPRP